MHYHIRHALENVTVYSYLKDEGTSLEKDIIDCSLGVNPCGVTPTLTKEAISMFFRNKFLFCQYSILSPTILNGSQAEFIASYGGYQVMAIASLQQLTADGHIRRLTVRPK